MNSRISRRRVITIAAAAAGLAIVPGPLRRAGAASGDMPLHRWRGSVLGAEASILLHHPDGRRARSLIQASVAEIARLERVFSLFRPDSAVSRLNRQGSLDHPPPDLLSLLDAARHFSVVSGGAFDITVQPLWQLYADHFSAPDADPAGPDPGALADARSRIDHAAVLFDTARVTLAKPGMAVTLNGIAQGYITDRVADLLRDAGLTGVLLDLGEVRALGRHPAGRDWRAGLTDPRDPARYGATLALADQALATSGGYGSPFEATGRHHHLFDPASGHSANRVLSVSVVCARATVADAMSTALAVMPAEQVDPCLAVAPPLTAIFVMPHGTTVTRHA